MSDFIREVQEEVRRERITRFFSRYSLVLVLVVVAFLAGVAWWRIAADNKVAAAQQADARFAAADQMAKDGKVDEAEAAYEALAKDGPAGYTVLAGLRAAELIAKGDPEAGAKRFDALADDIKDNQAMADTARFRGALIRVATMEPAAFAKKYGTFVGGNFAYHNSMRELIALADLKAKDTEGAGRILDDMLVDPQTPAAMRERVRVYRDLVTGGPVTTTNQPAPPATVTPVEATASAAQPPAPKPPASPPLASPPLASPPLASPPLATAPAAPAAPAMQSAPPPSPH